MFIIISAFLVAPPNIRQETPARNTEMILAAGFNHQNFTGFYSKLKMQQNYALKPDSCCARHIRLF
jgi:hypothetical protein